VTSATVGPEQAPDAPASRRRPVWALAVVVVAVAVVIAAAVWAIRGLFADPVKGTDAAGITTIEGSFEPYSCGRPCVGYVQAGGRSVAVVLPATCQAPAREEQIRVLGRLDTSQGKATYVATACPTAI
jgi:hypothetical protein